MNSPPSGSISQPFTRAEPLRSFAKYDLVPLAIVACLPLTLAIFNAYWIFTSTQSAWVDPWLYVSYFLHLKAELRAVPSGYYGDRLSVMLPGWLAYKILGPWLGNYVYKLCVIYTASFTFYFLARDLFGRRTALVGALLGCGEPYYLMAFGWDYVDGIGVAYCMLALYFAFRAARSQSYKPHLFLCGIFLNCTVTSHFLWMNLVWIVLAAYFWANRTAQKHSILVSLSMMAAGFISIFVVFCGIHYLLVGKWFYLENTIYHTLHNFGAAQKVNRPISSWLGWATWLVYYNGLVLPAIWLALRRRTPSVERMCLVLFVVSYLTVWGWQGVQFPFAMDSYYASFLLPAYLIGVGALLNQPLTGLTENKYHVVVALCLSAGVGLYCLAPAWDRLGTSLSYLNWGDWLRNHDMLPLSLICAAISVPICLSKSRRLLAVLVFVCGFLLVDVFELALQVKQGWFTGGVPDNGRGFRMVLDADAWVNQLVPDRKILWWSAGEEPRQGIIYGITSLFMWGYMILNEHFPNLPASDIERLHEDSAILVLSWRPDAIQAARSAFAQHGLQITSEHTTTVASADAMLHMGVFHVAPSSVTLQSNCLLLPASQSGKQPGADAPPYALSVNPASGVGSTQEFSFLFSDIRGCADLKIVQIDVNSSLAPAAGCYLWFERAARRVYLRSDDGSKWLGSVIVGTPASLENSQCVLSGAGSSVSGGGESLTLNLALSFRKSFAGSKTLYMVASDASSRDSGWQKRGTWVVP